jgi:hypothetical protein
MSFREAWFPPGGCGRRPSSDPGAHPRTPGSERLWAAARGEDLPGEITDGEIRWMPGARDRVGSHHFGTGPPAVEAGELVTLMGR